MPRLLLLAFALSLGSASFGIWQSLSGTGLVYYVNGHDECNYLQYWYSILNQSVAWRPGQALVTWLHEVGVSGGKINLLFDLLFPPIFLLLLAKVLRESGFICERAEIGALIILLFPIMISPLNPVLMEFRNIWMEVAAYVWMTIPEGAQLGWLRSPEPQVSYLVLLVATFFAVRLRSVFPVFFSIPLLYSFLGLPCLYLCVAWWLRRFGWMRLLLSAFVCGLCVLVYTRFGATNETLHLTAQSHLPLLTWCGILNLFLLRRMNGHFEGDRLLWVEALVWAPWFAANQQIISGIIIVPSNSEQYAGLLTTSLLTAALLLGRRGVPLSGAKITVITVGLLSMYAVCMAQIFANNRKWNSVLELSPALLTDLSQRSSEVAINDVYLGTTLSLLYPKQPALKFSFPKVYLGEASRSITEYRCAKGVLSKEPHIKEKFQRLFTHLDGAYRYETEDNPLNHIGRVAYGQRTHDTSALEDEQVCAPWRLTPYFVSGIGY